MLNASHVEEKITAKQIIGCYQALVEFYSLRRISQERNGFIDSGFRY